MWTALFVTVALLAGMRAQAAEPAEADWIARGFRFHTGEVFPELRIHYRTLGNPNGQPVLVLHGTAQTGAAMLTANFGGQLFGPGQPLDAARYFIIVPDAIGVGGSSKPSDGLRARFPAYNYADMVSAQYRLVSEGLGLRHLRLVIGNSMGGMQAWLWAEQHPGFADGYVPLASQPTAMASRNWMMRRLLVETIRADPAYANGDYTSQPPSLRLANAMFSIATSGGSLGWQAQAPSAAAADRLVDALVAAPPPADANDFVFQWQSSHDYDAEPELGRISAPVLAINAADDERNPPESGIMDRIMSRLPRGEYDLIPASAETRGHGTTGQARFWAERLR
ncbi:MAG: alpha/beta fold hydrolase, partial [Acetobacteraceae bacterium]|nr:alpha/beta fold hydrolase [Acetobacteraceae bacterium]